MKTELSESFYTFMLNLYLAEPEELRETLEILEKAASLPRSDPVGMISTDKLRILGHVMRQAAHDGDFEAEVRRRRANRSVDGRD